MDTLMMQWRTKFIQQGLRMIVLLQLTSYMWPQDTPLTDLQYYYDFIIVGCGTAGSILANRLTASGKYSVLVIEAGGDPPIESIYPGTFTYLPNSQYDWNFTTINDGYTAQAHKDHVLKIPKGKILGGDSSIGHLLYERGDSHDYKAWAKAAQDEAWNYENLLPYFKQAEKLKDNLNLNTDNRRFHSTDGKMGVTTHQKHISKKYLHAFNEAGHVIIKDANEDKTLGYYEPIFMIKDGTRQSMPITYLTPVKKRKNLHLLKETEAIEINFNGNRATGVTAIKNGRILKLNVKREVIISAGTMKTPQLLMLSGIGPSDHLETFDITVRNDLPVGKYYQDHLSIVLVHRFNIKSHNSSPPDPRDFPLPLVIGNVALNKAKPYPEYRTLNYIVPSDSDSLLTLCSVTYSFTDEVCQSWYNQTKGYEVMVSKIVLLHPHSKGHVVLQGKDYRDTPMILSGFYSHDEDHDSMTNYIADFLRVSKTNLFRKLGGELVHPKLTDCDNYPEVPYWKCYALNMIDTTHDSTSTCSIGRVVDNRLRVFDMEGLRIVDASVIPVITSGHTQAAVMAIAEKAADMILEDATLPSNCHHC